MALVLLIVVVAAVAVGAPTLAAALDIRLGAVVAGATAVIVAVVALAVVGVGVDRGGEGAEEPEAPVTTSPPVPASPPSTAAEVREPDLVAGVGGDGLPQPPAVLAGLGDGDAPLVELRGLLANARGTIRQCRTVASDCAPAIPVVTDRDGVAHVVVPLDDGAGDVLVVDVDDAGPTIELVFGAAAPRPTIEVEPNRARRDETITVTIRGVAPRAQIALAQCEPGRCGRRATARVGTTGSATIELEVDGTCHRGERCGVIAFDATSGAVLADPASLRILGSPGVDLDGQRVATGFAVAAVLVAAAWWLFATTDWRAVGLPSTTDDA